MSTPSSINTGTIYISGTKFMREWIAIPLLIMCGCSAPPVADARSLAVASCEGPQRGRVVEVRGSTETAGVIAVDPLFFSGAVASPGPPTPVAIESSCLVPLEKFSAVPGGRSLDVDCGSYQGEMIFGPGGRVESITLPADVHDEPEVSTGTFTGHGTFVLAEFREHQGKVVERYLFDFAGDRVRVFGTNQDCTYTKRQHDQVP